MCPRGVLYVMYCSSTFLRTAQVVVVGPLFFLVACVPSLCRVSPPAAVHVHDVKRSSFATSQSHTEAGWRTMCTAVLYTAPLGPIRIRISPLHVHVHVDPSVPLRKKNKTPCHATKKTKQSLTTRTTSSRRSSPATCPLTRSSRLSTPWPSSTPSPWPKDTPCSSRRRLGTYDD